MSKENLKPKVCPAYQGRTKIIKRGEGIIYKHTKDGYKVINACRCDTCNGSGAVPVILGPSADWYKPEED